MKMTMPVRWAIAGGAVGGLCGLAYFLVKERMAEAEEDTPEVAYTYEEALAKAKERAGRGLKDEVKLIGAVESPDIPEEELDEKRTAYHKIAEQYETTSEEVVAEPEPEKEPELEPWPDDKTGKYIRISEDKFKFENPYNTKLLGAYFPNGNKIGGWDNELEPIEDEELLRRMNTIWKSKDTMALDSYYFSDPDNSTDYEIEINECPWDEAYEDYKRS